VALRKALMAIDPETEFKRELEVFGNEVEEAIQCFYAEQTIHNVAREHENVHRALNRNAPFWNLVCRTLQANAIIVLGRIFDRDSRAHTVNRLLQLATQNPNIFSKGRSKSASCHTQANTQRSSCVLLTSQRSAISSGSRGTPISTGQSTMGIT
jgi:AbiU2